MPALLSPRMRLLMSLVLAIHLMKMLPILYVTIREIIIAIIIIIYTLTTLPNDA